MIRRFVEEAQIAGQLQHPGIVPVYELGHFADRRPYFAMKLVKGRTLAALLAERGRPGRRPAAAPGHLRAGLPDDGLRPRPGRDPPGPEAVEHHGRRLRRGPGDGLGPGQGAAERRNERGDAASTGGGGRQRDSHGRPDSDADTPQARSVWGGTPAYMAPEQRLPTWRRRTDEADVFGAGVDLVRILTGRPAYTGPSSRRSGKAKRGDTGDAVPSLSTGSGAAGELIAVARDLLAADPDEAAGEPPRSPGG